MDERDSGLWVCIWLNNDLPPNPISYHAESWSGVEYPVGALSYFEGLTQQAFTIVDDVRARQDGTRRSPWNEIECGDHYSRPQSSWSLLDAATGYLYNAPKSSFTFAPKLSPQNFTCFYITESGWGTYSQTGPNEKLSSGTVVFTVAFGVVKMKQLILQSTATTATVTLNAKTLTSASKSFNGKLTVDLAQKVEITIVDTLKVSLR